jgi:small nuclear ribonucleoprotein B and B'
MATQRSKFLQWIDFRVRITIQDARMMVGTFLAFDKHMNVVLADAE